MAGNFFTDIFSPRPSRYLIALKKISAAEAVRNSIQTHLMGLGVHPDAIDQVQSCVALANKFASESGVQADSVLQLAALDELDDVIRYVEENGVSGVSQWLQHNEDIEEDDGVIEMDYQYLKDTAREILEKTFEVAPECWLLVPRYNKQIHFLFFSELYETRLSSELLTKHPEAEQYLHRYPSEFVDKKFQEASSNAEFASYKARFHTFLAEFQLDQRLYVHRMAVYHMHCQLLFSDFGDYFNRSLTKEAEQFLQTK